ncbi:amino acid permease [Cetobacterium sp. 2A]|uniref:APC family permease n=1 Tax=Cetobacterium sp. 2A TaxID=2754723 RepID=UPI00163BCACD|nr:APC family permease [Cetobacterium sp. 2A]MBC2857380.1 amino acid permease [Cetobacterium sp. 2A]
MNKMIGPVAFTALAISSIFTTSNLAVLAANGGALFVLLLISIFFFFIPVALVVGELTTGPWGTNVFTWVEAAYGKKIGLAAVFWQWFQAIVMTLPMLYFTVGTFAYCIGFKELNTNPIYQLLTAIAFYLLLIVIETIKPRFLIDMEAFGFWFCIMIPVFALFIFSLVYIFQGHSPAFPFTVEGLIPKFDLQSFLALIPYISCLTGIEISGPFVKRLVDVKKNFPKAILIVVITAILANLVGSGAIALIFPTNQINLSSGFIEVYDFLFNYYGIPLYIVKILGMLVVFGMLIKTSNWQISPALALNSSANTNLLPKKFGYQNSKGTPIYILWVQLIALTILGIFLSMSKSGNIAFLIAVYLDVSIYCCVYVLIFLTYFKLNKTQPNAPKLFTMPVKLKIFVPLIGLLTTIGVIGLCFIPPGGVPKDQYTLYISILTVSFFCAFVAPFLIGDFFTDENKKKVQ